MTYKLEYSQIVRRKLKSLKLYLSKQYGEDFAKAAVKTITDRARDLQKNPDIGVDLSAKYDIDTNFRELFVNHNHLFYYKDKETIIVAEMFGEREDFMYKLYGISGRTQESIDYWGE
jgi:plasmid stabilization system protein ParE